MRCSDVLPKWVDAYHHAQKIQAVEYRVVHRIETGASDHNVIRYRTLHRSRKIGPKANDTSANGSRRALDEARPPPIDEVDLARCVGDVGFPEKCMRFQSYPYPEHYRLMCNIYALRLYRLRDTIISS